MLRHNPGKLGRGEASHNKSAKGGEPGIGDTIQRADPTGAARENRRDWNEKGKASMEGRGKQGSLVQNWILSSSNESERRN